ncbi:MAG: large subunit ribosomal protein [Methanolobus sp.]|jgi:large subunit ribosomal protein L15|uniref:Large ribosomal subunit protein uL15 n=1 Tax=Methanolobus tindarius DSM 2278 TaxID=1090322 RepID=W9DSB1_METTI|nr:MULTISPECIES: uL15 family ribosomal protein [Methanolobus]ETA68678.1 ribosomal protein L15 [Methanolobus tindarius DSM 2278]MDK2832591.1 large subunit ribosomal protein [Methanolobus sp.]MDK2939605.1 large subunit ribosomal protein [Methanolobus sp.]
MTSKKTNTKKFRGSRTCGGGTTKNRRGAGNRGGRGRSGENKHHFSRAVLLGYCRGHQRGFTRPLKVLNDASIVNVGELDELADQLVEDGFAELQDGTYVIDLAVLDIDKVLGSGKVSKKLAITAAEFSASAKEKIEGAGGSCTEIEE